jgi:branched-chain amino acid transport system substrate-binding protein
VTPTGVNKKNITCDENMWKKKSLFVLITGLMVFSALSVAVESAPFSVSEVDEASALPATIKVCGSFPTISRPEAGRDRRDGFLIAIDEVNADPEAVGLPAGTTLDALVKEDDDGAEAGTTVANACIADGAHVVIGTSSSSTSAAMQDVLKTQKIVQLSYASSSPTLSDKTTYPYLMRNVASDADQGVALADLVKAFGWTKGATINTDDTYGTGLPSVFTERFEADGGEILSAQTFAPSATDVSGQVQAIADTNPEFVLLNAIDVRAKLVLKEAHELGLTNNVNTAWLLTDGSTTTATFAGDDTVKEAMQYAMGTNPASSSRPLYAAFNTTWFSVTSCGGSACAGPVASQSSGTAFNSYAPFAYDAVYIMAKGLAAADTTEGDALLAALYDVVQLKDSTYTAIGTWSDTLTLTSGTVTLPGGSTWDVSGNTATCSADCRAGPGVPGFSVVSLFFLGIAAVVVISIKKRK